MFWIKLDKNAKVSMARQIFLLVRERILSGEFPAGMRLPSTRELAGELVVSRNVTVEAYEMLLAEGYLTGRHGSGTYVAQGASLLKLPEKAHGGENRDGSSKSTIHKLATSRQDIIDFRSGLPALDLFPVAKWSVCCKEAAGRLDPGLLGYGSPAGSMELRSTLCRYLYNSRGVVSKPENIIITTGAVQALQLITNLLLGPEKTVLLEDPSNHDLQSIFSSTGAEIIPVPADQKGIRTEFPDLCGKPGIVYVTPSHQFPLGGLLPIQRRIELVAFAQANGLYVVEDDYDSEYRYSGPAVSSLQSLDPERVIYVGTFSKILFPALRIGYMVLPEELTRTCIRLKRHSDFQTPILEQLVLSRFIEDGSLARHVHKMKRIYVQRQETLTCCLLEAFGTHCTISGNSTGLHLIAGFDFKINTERQGRLKKAGVRVYPVELHSIKRGIHMDKLIMGYGHLEPGMIREGVARMKNSGFAE